jgi:hypothetical protein
MNIMIKKGYVYGLGMGAALIAYFLLMKVFGLEANFYLRIFNFVILIGGVTLLLNSQVKKSPNTVTYFEGLGLGIRSTVTSVIVFIAFMAAYISLLDPEFMAILQSSQIWGNNLGLLEVTVAILIEGIASSFVISFGMMQYFKKYTVSPNAPTKI